MERIKNPPTIEKYLNLKDFVKVPKSEFYKIIEEKELNVGPFSKFYYSVQYSVWEYVGSANIFGYSITRNSLGDKDYYIRNL